MDKSHALQERDRIFGLEDEDAFIADFETPDGTKSKQVACLPLQSHRYISRLPDFPVIIPMQGGHLPEGDRTYLEAAGHYGEYSTRESTSPLRTVLHEQDGEAYLQKVAEYMANYTDGALYPLTVRAALKRTLGEHGDTCGMHENYLGLRSIDMVLNRGYGPLLASHLVTRVWAGGGGVRQQSGGGHEFTAAAKLTTVETVYNQMTIDQKPVVNLRDTPYADELQWRRIHVTSGDGNLWPWPQFVKLGSTSLVLRLRENNMPCDDLLLADPVEAAAVCSFVGLTPDNLQERLLSARVELRRGRLINPIELQLLLVERCEQMAERFYISAEERLALVEWRRTCEQLLIDAVGCRQHVEFIGKLLLGNEWLELNRGKGSYKVNLNTFENAWCNLDPAKSIGMKTRDRYEPQQQIMALAAQAISEPTRADGRGAAVAWTAQHIDEMGWPPAFRWDCVRTEDAGRRILDPFNPDPEPWLEVARTALGTVRQGLAEPLPFSIDDLLQREGIFQPS